MEKLAFTTDNFDEIINDSEVSELIILLATGMQKLEALVAAYAEQNNISFDYGSARIIKILSYRLAWTALSAAGTQSKEFNKDDFMAMLSSVVDEMTIKFSETPKVNEILSRNSEANVSVSTVDISKLH